MPVLDEIHLNRVVAFRWIAYQLAMVAKVGVALWDCMLLRKYKVHVVVSRHRYHRGGRRIGLKCLFGVKVVPPV